MNQLEVFLRPSGCFAKGARMGTGERRRSGVHPDLLFVGVDRHLSDVHRQFEEATAALVASLCRSATMLVVSATRTGPDVPANAADRQRLGVGVTLGVRRAGVALVTAGCSHAPTLDLFGSYFPAWMLCAAVGVFATVIFWRILAMAGIHEYVIVPLLTYTGLALSATLLSWLLWFGH
jgi:hypothetical protein